jgi:hypothetical protein
MSRGLREGNLNLEAGMNALRVAGLSPLLLAAAAAIAPLPCQVPTTTEQIPIYPGAVRQPDREKQQFGDSLQPGQRVYVVRAPIEDVARFYAQRLHAREFDTEDEFNNAIQSAGHPAPGQTTGVFWRPTFMDLSVAHFAGLPYASNPAKEAAAARAAYTQKRRPFRPNQWLLFADFAWTTSPRAGQELDWTVHLEDSEREQLLDSAYFHETEITFDVRNPVSVSEMPTESTFAPAPPMAAPAAADLGVPLYPGARFDGQMSASLSQGDKSANYYVYTTADGLEQVTSFYEQRTGKTGQRSPAGVMIVVQGQGPFPDLGVTVQPNGGGMYPPSVKTVITIRKKR